VAYFNGTVNLAVAQPERLLHLCLKLGEVTTTRNKLASTLSVVPDHIDRATYEAAVKTAADTYLANLRQLSNAGDSVLLIKWDLYLVESELAQLQHATANSAPDGTTAAAWLQQAVDRARAALAAPPVTQQPELAGSPGSPDDLPEAFPAADFNAARLAASISVSHRERVAQAAVCMKKIERLRRQLGDMGGQPFPPDVSLVDVARSALLQLTTWLQEVGNSVRARHSKVRYGQVQTLRETALKPNRRQALLDNVKFFNILRPLVEGRPVVKQLEATQVLNSDSWLIDVDGGGLFPQSAGSTHQHFAFVNAAFTVIRVREELVACQHEMLGTLVSLASRFFTIAGLVVSMLSRLLNNVVWTAFIYVLRVKNLHGCTG
jgi:hypothetical protein